jgi:thiamine-phosphate pyrophosphorylase
MERAVYRIIDANFNRAREAIRVIEDYCRFALNSAPLSERAKQLRHQLSAAINKLDAGRLISSRDTLGDVGAGKTVDTQLTRSSLNDCFTAGCKRLTEALRTLAEMSHTQNRAVAETIEKLRFAAYALEKDIVLFAEPAEKFKRVGLYVVITSNLPADVISLAHKCVAGGADCIQIRAKGINDDTLFATAVEFVQICKAAGVLGIINDRVDIAVAAGADGVHLGQNDLPIEQARKLELSPLIIGKSTHSLKQLYAACSEAPAYVSLGPVFASETKPDVEVAGLNYVREGTKKLIGTGIGNVAIGGITPDNVTEVLDAGATAIAVSSGVAKAADAAELCRKLKERITRHLRDKED